MTFIEYQKPDRKGGPELLELPSLTVGLLTQKKAGRSPPHANPIYIELWTLTRRRLSRLFRGDVRLLLHRIDQFFRFGS